MGAVPREVAIGDIAKAFKEGRGGANNGTSEESIRKTRKSGMKKRARRGLVKGEGNTFTALWLVRLNIGLTDEACIRPIKRFV